MKKCFKCGIEKPITEYYKHFMMADGHLNKCKDCTKSDTKKRADILLQDPEFVKSERDRGREKYHRLQYKGKHYPTRERKKLYMDKWMDKYPEKRKAKRLSGNIKIKDGYQNHHWSYNEAHCKDVIGLTKKEHYKAHRFMIYDQERMMYRTIDGILLDTKERHLAYIMDKIQNESD